jgi:hypothetical protein
MPGDRNHLQEQQIEEVHRRMAELPVPEEDLATFESRVRQQVRRVVVTPLTGMKHPLIEQLLERDERPRGHGLGVWPRFDSRIDRRRLRFLNTLFLAFERYDSRPEISDERAYEVAIRVGGTSVPSASHRRTGRTIRFGSRCMSPGRTGADPTSEAGTSGERTSTPSSRRWSSPLWSLRRCFDERRLWPRTRPNSGASPRWPRRNAGDGRRRSVSALSGSSKRRRLISARRMCVRSWPPLKQREWYRRPGQGRSLAEWAPTAADRIDPLVQRRPCPESSARQR